MLALVLQELQKSKEPLSVAALSKKLNIDQSALEGMLDHWVRKKRLIENNAQGEMPANCAACSGHARSCHCSAQCPFIARMPKTYSIAAGERGTDND
ncbi:MAG: hypothetical protein GXY37_02760 [Chloroflexi bacterium]|nr:hypothetical protein [Chloroflexota bacterium]